MYCVYKHTGPSGKVYIGITKRKPQKRWNSGRGYVDNRYFYRAIQKYGWENFKHEIIADGLDKEEASEMERKLISEYDSTNPEVGYNIEAGGIDGPIVTDAMRVNLSKRGKRMLAERPDLHEKFLKGRDDYFSDPQNVKKHSDTLKRYYQEHPEARKRISEQTKARLTDEYRQRASEAQKKAHGTPEARKRARDSHKAQMIAIEQWSLDGKLIACYECIGDAVRATGICRQNIMKVLKHTLTKAGRERQTAGGYKWRYVDEG